MAPLSEHHLDALELVGGRLARATSRFALGGSALLAAHHLDVEVNDLDVLVWGTARAPVVEALAPLGTFVEKAKHRPWDSDWLIGGEVAGLPVEVICRLGYLEDGVLFTVPEGTSGVVGSGFPLSELAYWYHLYAWYNPGKADLVAGVVSATELEAARLEMIGYS
jgi:hypothetical protein